MANGQFQIDDDGMITVVIGSHTLLVDAVGEHEALQECVQPFLVNGELPTDQNDTRWIKAVQQHIHDTHNIRIGPHPAVEYWNLVSKQAHRVADFFTQTPESPSGTESPPESSPGHSEPGTSSTLSD